MTASPLNPSDEELARLRAQIDAIDVQLVDVLDRRGALVFAVGDWKRRAGRAAHDPARESAIIDKAARLPRAHLADGELRELLQALIAAYRACEARRMLAEGKSEGEER